MKEEKEQIKIVIVKIEELKPAEYNPREWNPKAIKGLTDSMKKFGLVDPIIVNGAKERKNIVIGGHFRLKIAKDLGYKKVPVVYVNIDDIEKEKELNLRLNANTGEWDYELLKLFPENLLNDLNLNFNFQETDLKKEFEGMTDYEHEDLESFKRLIVHFDNVNDYNDFAKLVGQKLTDKTRQIWYPEVKSAVFKDKKYV